jgi:hypothetical protein
VFCPDCRQRIQSIALESGPQIVHHKNRAIRGANGRRSECSATFVVVPRLDTKTYDLKIVRDRQHADETLKLYVDSWLHGQHLAMAG